MAKGGGKKGGARRRTQRSQQYNRMAANNIALQDQSQADMLGTLNQQTQQDLQRRSNSAESIYGGGLKALRNTTPTDYSGIAGQMNNALTTLAPNFGGQAYQAPGEGAAGNALGLAYGEAGNTMLANMAAREGQHQGSSERQMGLMGTYAQDRVHQDIDDSLQQYRNQLQNLRANDPYQIQQEATRLEDQAVSNRLGMSQIKSDAAFSKYLQDMLGNSLSSSGRPGGRPGGGGPGGGGNPTGPGGQTGGHGLGDTAAGGNAGNGQVPPNQGGYTNGMGTETSAGGNSFAGIPNAWTGAQSYGQLPGLVQNTYERDPGVSLRESFNLNAHPSFNNFTDFRSAYQRFLDEINKLYSSSHGQMTGALGG